MTSRKNQQAARGYMRTHPEVPYMEALRRTSGPDAGPTKGLSPEAPDGVASEGATPPRMFFDERDQDRPRVITVAGWPGDGKTTLLRGLMEQYRDSPAFVLHAGDLLEGIEPWPLLTALDARHALRGRADFPAPFDLDAIPNGSLVVLDLSYDFAGDEGSRWGILGGVRPGNEETISQWVDFYEVIPRVARGKGITVMISVNVPYVAPGSWNLGDMLKHLSPRLLDGVVIKSMRTLGAPWGTYAVVVPGLDSEPSFFVFDAENPAPEAREGLPLLK